MILADEPTGALDSQSGKEVMAILRQLCDAGHTVIIVTHDPSIAAQAARIIEIKDGHILSDSGSVINPQAKALAAKPALKSSAFSRFLGRFNEALLMAWRAMVVNKMRTLLTMLGIIIGIASVVTILVIGDAAKALVLSDIKSIGTNTIFVYPAKISAVTGQDQQSLKPGDVDVIRQQPYVYAASAEIENSARLRGAILIPQRVLRDRAGLFHCV